MCECVSESMRARVSKRECARESVLRACVGPRTEVEFEEREPTEAAGDTEKASCEPNSVACEQQCDHDQQHAAQVRQHPSSRRSGSSRRRRSRRRRRRRGTSG